LLNEEAKELEALGVDTIQFDEPAFNAFMSDVVEWGVDALNRARRGLRCTTAVHICYGYGIKENIDWKKTLGEEWRQYEEIFPSLNRSDIDQVSLECANSRVPMSLIGLLSDKDVLVGAIDVASLEVESPEQVAATIVKATQYVAPERILPCTNCGLAPLPRDVAVGKLRALGAGAELARQVVRPSKPAAKKPARPGKKAAKKTAKPAKPAKKAKPAAKATKKSAPKRAAPKKSAAKKAAPKKSVKKPAKKAAKGKPKKRK
ncbi:MAG: hypothetical protein AB7G34_14760, partial [Hyphomicrobiales bacterium]